MALLSNGIAARAIDSDAQTVREIRAANVDDQTDSENGDWFGKLARPLLLGSDAGFVLHKLTGFLPRTAARYVTKDGDRRQPPGFFIRQLLRSPQGAIWLEALMEGSEVKWWREHQSLKSKADQFDQIRALVGR